MTSASAVSSVVADGPAAGCRAIDLRVSRGLDVRVLPDRGLDLGAAWFRGVPLAWISAVGECAPRGDWGESWGGGLVTTCGLRNVGAPSEGHGQHGAFTFQRAADVAVSRRPDQLVVSGMIVEASLEVRRTITTWAGEGRLLLRDVTRNLGSSAEPAPLLYHCNFGAPLWAPGARVVVPGGRVPQPRDADAAAALASWDVAPAVEPGAPERVFEHPVVEGRVMVESPPAGVRVEVRWDVAPLPRLHQWVHPAFGVLGIEPANCSVLGRAADRAAGRLPVLEPGEERVTRLEIHVDEFPAGAAS